MTIDEFVRRYQEIDGPGGADDKDYQSHIAVDMPILAFCKNIRVTLRLPKCDAKSAVSTDFTSASWAAKRIFVKCAK